ncbi:hypothetical protein ACWCQZ_44185 [Streptomyces sp. NPDC002285]
MFRTSTPGYTGAPPLSAVTGVPPGDAVKPGVTTIVVEGAVFPPTVNVRLVEPGGASWPALTATHITVVPGRPRSTLEKTSEVPFSDRVPVYGVVSWSALWTVSW